MSGPAQPGSPASAELAEVVNSAKLATLGMMVAGVAHEINTPLGALFSNHDVLKRALGKLQAILADEVVEPSELDEVRRIVAALDGILRVNDMAVERLTHLVGSLRNFGRPDRAETGMLNVHESLETTLAILGHRMKGRIEVRREYGAVPPIECNPHQVTQLFMNLLLNAVQAIPEMGEIRIATRPAEDRAIVEIADTGTGIPPEQLGRIFEPGFTTRGTRVGMGLGLLIVRQIVDHHGGTIDVRSRPGEGTTFIVTLPFITSTGGTA